jgi:XTP/dITP diphosphohydrolase
VGIFAARHAEVQLTLLVTSPRVAPGLMSWSAWSAVAGASQRLASSADAPVVKAVVAAGHPVRTLPSPTAADLLAAARADGSRHPGGVVWLADDEEAERLPSLLATVGPDAAEVEIMVLHASYDVPGARLLDLVTVMDRLRSECPWDREQTHRSLARYLLEETYETLEAIESGDQQHLREELGDLLLQVFFHARVAAEAAEEAFTIDDVAGGIVDKLVHRHPHVFAGLDVADVGEVERNWEALKATEKGRGSVLDGIPTALPALALADKVLGRAARVGVAPDASGPGGALLQLVVNARTEGVDPEQALRESVRALVAAVRAAEADAR